MSEAALLKQYAQRVLNLVDPDESGLDEELVVLTRDSVADVAWSPAQQAEIERLDDALVAHWRQFEDVLPNPNFQDRARWWWFLNEGPQVREEAQRLDREPAQA